MGYTTYFEGAISVVPEITEELKEYINKFAETRRMKRDSAKLLELYPDVTGKTLPGKDDYGIEGEFFVGAKGSFGQDSDDSIVNYNDHPSTQPGLWCQWIINDDGEIEWDEGEKFYNAGDWMIYIIDNFLAPNGYVCNGTIDAQGEESDDTWQIIVENNKVRTIEGVVTYGEPSEIKVQTDTGELKAEKSTDPNYPGIYVSVNGETVALIEKRPEDLSVRTVLYNNNDDDYDHVHYHDSEDREKNMEV